MCVEVSRVVGVWRGVWWFVCWLGFFFLKWRGLVFDRSPFTTRCSLDLEGEWEWEWEWEWEYGV